MKKSEQAFDTPNAIGLYWDQLWRQLNAMREPALWDVPPSEAVGRDLLVFKPYFSPILPLVDLGCGSGLQSFYLAQFFSRVIGVDISKKAIANAQKTAMDESTIFLHLDTLDQVSVGAFYEKYGMVNVYMRGVLHQIPMNLRPVFINNLKHLLGQSGALYLIETDPSIQDYIEGLAGRFSNLPLSFKRVLTSNLPPLGVSLLEIQKYFPEEEFQVLHSGKTSLSTNIELEQGRKVELPAIFALIRPVNTQK